MKNLKENQELKEAKELLIEYYQEAIHIIDILGYNYIEKYLDEDDAMLFEELAETIFDYYDVLDTIDKDDIDDWISELDYYLSFFN